MEVKISTTFFATICADAYSPHNGMNFEVQQLDSKERTKHFLLKQQSRTVLMVQILNALDTTTAKPLHKHS